MTLREKLIVGVFIGVFVPGCGNPATEAVKIGIQVVGKVVDDVEVDKLGKELLGQSAGKADEVLGATEDVYAAVNDDRQWRVYPVPVDVLGNQRYVVETTRGHIVLVEKVEKDSGKLDIPLELVYHEKLKGKTPEQCQAELNMGPPVMVVRSETTGLLFRFYDARLIKEFSKPHYLIARFDENGKCDKVKFAEVAASTTQE